MAGRRAKEIYDKLTPFLRIVKPLGAYPPPKWKGEKDSAGIDNPCKNWPLAYRNEAFYPTCCTWNPNREGCAPTFEQFLYLYNITIYDL
jgi:hypothetical protein